MIIYGTMSVKNEADILGDSIESSLRWVDKIFVVDNGSQDSTLGILKCFGDRVTLLATFNGEFQEGLKSIPFNWVNKSRFYPLADWWCILDADEIYYEDPIRFLKKVPDHFGRVCTNTIEFIGLEDSELPLQPESYSHYIPLDWSESRFFRNISSLRWCNYNDNGPSGVGATYHKRIKVLHFPFRTESQIKKRMEIRNRNRKDSGIAWHNVDYKNVETLLDQYNKEHRKINDGALEFMPTARNFIVSPYQRLTRRAKMLAYYVGFYR